MLASISEVVKTFVDSYRHINRIRTVWQEPLVVAVSAANPLLRQPRITLTPRSF